MMRERGFKTVLADTESVEAVVACGPMMIL